MNGRHGFGALALLLASALTGCANLPTSRPESSGVLQRLDWPQRRALLQGQAGFALKGRLAVAVSGEGFSAGLRWRQQRGDALIDLDGPFGVGGLRLESRDGALELMTARGERLDGAAARVELERRLGFALPLESLRYWVCGVPDPALAAEERPASDAPRLTGLAQGGWQVEYVAYVDDPVAGSLPRRLSVTREGTRLRLLIDDWAYQVAP